MEIKLFARNAKKHPDAQLKLIAKSLREYGWRQPIVTDKKGEIVVGHGRFMAYTKYPEGIKKPWVVTADDLTPEQVRGYRLMDNKSNESDWDMALAIEELKELDAIGYDIGLTGFDSDLLLDDEAKDDALPETSPRRAHAGELWQLGPHRLLCGDATNRDDVQKLMGGGFADMVFTDPPYNVDYQGGMGATGKNTRAPIKNDKMGSEAFAQFLLNACANMHEVTKGAEYICMSSSEIDTLKASFEKSGGHWQTFIVWVKNHFTLSRADYQNTSEMILYGWPSNIHNHYFIGERGAANVWEDLTSVKTEYDGQATTISFQGFKVRIPGKVEKGEVIRKKQRTDIWRYDKPIRSAIHPTMKPVALVLEAVINSSKKGNIVLDPFLGSGSTLIACEKAGRVCVGLELDPKFADVIIHRYEQYTGNKAGLVAEKGVDTAKASESGGKEPKKKGR